MSHAARRTGSLFWMIGFLERLDVKPALEGELFLHDDQARSAVFETQN